MEDFFSQKQIGKMEKNALKIANRMFDAAKGGNSVEVMYASMRIIAFLLSQQFETRDQAYSMMAELFKVGDSLLEDLDEKELSNWSK
jgi:hypothetical protein